MTPTQHEKNEWSRLAQDAYRTGHNFYGHRYSAMSAWPTDATMRIDVFDTLQDTYREWLLRGWVNIDAIDKALDPA